MNKVNCLFLVILLLGCSEVITNLPATNPEMEIFLDNEMLQRNASYNLGTYNANSSARELFFAIKNTGDSTLKITGVVLNSQFNFRLSLEPQVFVLPGESTTFSIRYTPGEPGEESTEISISHNISGKDRAPYVFSLFTQCIDPGHLTPSPTPGSTPTPSPTPGVSTPIGTLPAAPGALAVTSRSSTWLEFTWQDNSDNETGFILEYKEVGDARFSEVVTLPAGTTTYLHQGLTENTSYLHRIKAINKLGDSAYSAEKESCTLHKGVCIKVHNQLPADTIIPGNTELDSAYINIYNHGDESAIVTISKDHDISWIDFENNEDEITEEIPPDNLFYGSDGNDGLLVIIDTSGLSWTTLTGDIVIYVNGKEQDRIGLFYIVQ